MKTKEVVKNELSRVDKEYALAIIKAAVLHIIFFTFSLLLSRLNVFNTLLPFGISAAASVGNTFASASVLGALGGYLFPVNGLSGFRYISCIFGVAALRIIISFTEKLRRKAYVYGLIAAVPTFITGMVAKESLPLVISESLLSYGGAYFIFKGLRALSSKKLGLRESERACVTVTVSLMIASFFTLNIGGLSLGVIGAFLFIFITSKAGGVSVGTVCSLCLSLLYALNGGDTVFVAVMGFSGLLCGVFAHFHKAVSVFAVFLSATASLLASGFTASVGALLADISVAGAIFILIPKLTVKYVGRIFCPAPGILKPGALKKAVIMRLRFASSALNDVRKTTEEVAEKLSKINCPDYSDVLRGIENDACVGCSFRMYCWETKREDTLSAVMSMTSAIKKGENDIFAAAPDNFKGSCIRNIRFAEAVYKRYNNYALQIAAENRIEEVRSVVCDEFCGISNMLNDLASEMDDEIRFDSALAEKIAAALKNINIIVDACTAKIDRYGKVTAEIYIKNIGDTVLNRAVIMKELCSSCDRDFAPPEINQADKSVFITVCEKPKLSVEYAVCSKSADGGSVCGDSCNSFYDGEGNFVTVLSDGMGTGGRAAVDGAMACGIMSRLIKAGFGFDPALKILNSSMLFKSTDESLATVDITAINLFTGKLELYKAGAAPTLIRRGVRCGKAQSTSLPAGILRNVTFDKATIAVRKGDIVVMMTDGAVTSGTEWISSEIEKWTDGTAGALAERICNGAARRNTNERLDDITVAVILIK